MADLEPSVAHAAAIVALARAGLDAMGSAVTCYLDDVPEPPAFPYVVFWSAPGTPVSEAERMAGWGQEVETVTQATVAGLTPTDVLGAVDRLALALHRRKPTIAGRQVGDFQLDGAAARPDRDPVPTPEGQVVWTTVLFFRLMSSPTSNRGA
ncbi:hypothetical protein ACIBTV_27385 [Micromonospora sp. NPDC049366]|uniref:hypothetical protein n=1 Tax=Micromonospora sp. NPDC049366 TaxID=3364271 RepID=UPI003796470C